jgi:hypothetical protein
MEKRFIKSMGILPLISCNTVKPYGNYFHENKEIYEKFTGRYSFGKFTSIDGNFPSIDGNFPRMISYYGKIPSFPGGCILW